MARHKERYPVEPVVGAVVRVAAFPHHSGWTITDIYESHEDYGKVLSVQLRSNHNGDVHGEQWGVVAQQIRTGAFVMAVPVVAAVAVAA